ncbi:hypothetical protein COT99_00820 [Candidatus Falkowbacteria bacterium CG10_big_fil_rev_8_21_14_0_10_43_10]|uniref:Glycosyltransferase RgtA/B/C/D-like domain-containing protein n=1 Tax=Candidatus Falkowbacteria bacterium CG10_big_fil_rev_8_21_14_0_10_43_10 TaxID=1974567 RepID=A0A2H0V2U2_9BACT|nr:MAG: hypothetical protein COT99_00820 [Candidatus Falkowbacteria bacterium CG10_big_fil_rev_8_21_14_0_10_43_10]
MANFFKDKKDNRKLFLSIFFACLTLSFLFYFNTLSIFFFSDDFEWLSFGERIKDNFLNIYQLRVSSFYSPIVNLFFFFGQCLYPFKSSVYHLAIILAHALNAALLFLFIDKVYKNKSASIFGALFFLFSAYHYEAIIWISAVMHILVTFLILLACLAYLEYAASKNSYYLLLSYFFAVLCFFTKESGVAVFAFIPLLYLYRQKENWFFYGNWKHLLPFFITLANILIYSYLWQRNSLWITGGIYKIEFGAYRQLVNSIFTLFYFPLNRFLIENPAIICLAVLFLIIVALVILAHKKYFREYLLAGCFIVIGFLPTLFFNYGTWNAISAGRYSYLPTVGGGMLMSLLFIFVTNFYFKKIAAFIFIILFIFYAYQNYNIIAGMQTEYAIVDRQMRGMLDSLLKHREKIDNSERVIIVQSYPFYGNNYYRYMYNYFVSSNYQGKWESELDWNTAIDRYTLASDLILGWNDVAMEFFIANDKNNPVQNPALANKKYPDQCLIKKKIDLVKIKLPDDIAKIDRIEYFEADKKLLLIAQEADGQRALWSYQQNKFKRLIKIKHIFFNGFIEADSKNNIYFMTNEPNFIYKSSDYGKSWRLVQGDPPPFWGIADAGGGIMYGSAWTFNSPIIYKSYDQGDSWQVWKNFSKIFPQEAIKYATGDERFKIRHLHDIAYRDNSLIVGTGDITRQTVLSDDNGDNWRQIWNEGFTSYVFAPAENSIFFGSDKNGGYGIAGYSFNTKKTNRVWNPLICDWSGYIYSMIEKNGRYYAAVHNENSNSLKYGILMSEDRQNWRPILEIMPDKQEFQSDAFIAGGLDDIIYVSLNDFLYYSTDSPAY